MIIPKYYEDLNMLHENTMPARHTIFPLRVRWTHLLENVRRLTVCSY